MVDLTKEMADLMSALGRPQGAQGRTLMFVSAYDGEGVSTVAREYARCEAAFSKRPVWLVDADVRRQGQLDTILTEEARFGPPGPVSRATPDGSVFFTLTPKSRSEQAQSDAHLLIARPFLDKRLWVTRLRDDKIEQGQRVKLIAETPYWQVLKQHAQTVIIDVAAFERADHAVHLAAQVDGIVMVVAEGQGDINSRVALKTALEQAGGRILGLVYNRARATIGSPRRPLRKAPHA
ncbi:CpsD/CapB family tyrosine-protein kinase [Asticcacaulis tiandongensis]|uniref:CpsD/CapB family tyrosine-protein kinase n=1 Tax=Asticcacaulis tiandongensis TaxID=2565365 RepID=UPI0011278BB2|nr:CpsD/CapB family tyrosine-protein kinase [Asticcacaulis tiandongensis]